MPLPTWTACRVIADGDGKHLNSNIDWCGQSTDRNRIFIIEGAVTATVGILMKWWLVDWPEDATFLTPEEKAVLLARLSRDRAEEARMDRWNAKRVFKDWKVYVGYANSHHHTIPLTH